MSKPRSFAPIIAAVVLLLPVLYVGSYLALVVPGGILVAQGPNVNRFLGHYRLAPDSCRSIYLPLELIDRQLRPGAWKRPWDDPEPG